MKASPPTPQIVQQQFALDIYLKTLLDEIPEASLSEAIDLQPLNEAAALALDEPPRLTAVTAPPSSQALIRRAPPVEPVTIIDAEPIVKAQALSVMPGWAQQEFQALFFKVEHMILATPLHDLSRTIKLDRKIGKIPGQPSWFMGLLDDQDSRIGVLDTGQLVFGKQRGSQRDLETQPFKQILITEDKRWGLACDEILSIGRLQPDKVRWRTQRRHRPWLIGTVIEELTAIIDLHMLVPHRKTTHHSF